MAATGDREPTALSPDEAFAAVGNETRMQILQTLGEAEPLSFSELYDRIDLGDSGNFTYHLDKLVEHFVRKTDDEYELQEPGSIIVQAVLSGIITEAPVLEPTRLNAPCPYCGGPVEVSFSDDRVLVRCTECAGTYSGSDTDARFLESHPHGTIAIFRLPPAGLDGRSPEDVLEAALARTHNEILAMSENICPRCSATVARSLQVCEDHDTSTGICERCNRRRALSVDYRCTNCIRVEENIPAGLHLVRVPKLMSFISAHDINPVIPSWDDLSTILGYKEELRSVDPLEATFTYTIDEDSLTISVNEDLAVVEVSR